MQQLLADIAGAFPAQLLSPASFADSHGMWISYVNDRTFEEGSNGQVWSTLPHDFVESHAAALGYMNVAAFIAVLPAYLVALVEGTQNEMPVFVLGELTRKDAFGATFDARFAAMTPQQHRVIAGLLETLAKTERFSYHYGPEIAAAVETWRAIAASATT